MSHDLLHRLKVLEREKKDRFKNQTDVIIQSIKQGLERYKGLESYNALQHLEEYREDKLNQARLMSSMPGCRIDTPRDFDDLEFHRLSVRISIDLLCEIEEIAKKRGAEIHHTSQKTNLSPTIIYLIELGLERLEKKPIRTIRDSLMLYPPPFATATAQRDILDKNV